MFPSIGNRLPSTTIRNQVKYTEQGNAHTGSTSQSTEQVRIDFDDLLHGAGSYDQTKCEALDNLQ